MIGYSSHVIISSRSPRLNRAVASAFALIISSSVGAIAGVPSPLAPEDFVAGSVSELMTPDKIREKLGPPESVMRSPDPLDRSAELITWRYAGLDVDLANESSVRGITLTDPRYKTSRGLRVGDRPSKITKLYGKPSNKYKSAWDYQAADNELHVMRVKVEASRVKWIYLGWLHD